MNVRSLLGNDDHEMFGRDSTALGGALALLIVAIPTARAQPSGSPTEREVDRAVVLVRAAGSRVLGLLDRRRRAGNRHRVRCVDDTLSELNSAARQLELRRIRALDADRRGDVRAARRERRAVRVLLARVRSLEEFARRCGLPAVGPPGTRLEVEIDPRIPRLDI